MLARSLGLCPKSNDCFWPIAVTGRRWPGRDGRFRAIADKFRDECLNEHWFTSLAQARDVICDYNEARPHSSCGRLHLPSSPQGTTPSNPTVMQKPSTPDLLRYGPWGQVTH